MNNEPFSPLERQLLETLRRMEQSRQESTAQIQALEQAVASQVARIGQMEAMLQKMAAVLGRSYLPNASS